jgi:hypothetical protein
MPPFVKESETFGQRYQVDQLEYQFSPEWFLVIQAKKTYIVYKPAGIMRRYDFEMNDAEARGIYAACRKFGEWNATAMKTKPESFKKEIPMPGDAYITELGLKMKYSVWFHWVAEQNKAFLRFSGRSPQSPILEATAIEEMMRVMTAIGPARKKFEEKLKATADVIRKKKEAIDSQFK